MQPASLLIVWFLAFLLLHSLYPSSGQLGNLTSVSLTASIDRYSQLAMHDIVLAYRLQQPNVTLSLTAGQASPAVLSQISSGLLDFGTTTSSLTAAQVAAQPTVNMYPVVATALVPIYRLDALMATGVTLVLSRAALAAIYEGQLTWWNDSRILVHNPTATLPKQRITVVYHDEAVGLNSVLTVALAKFDANFTDYCTVGAMPDWPSYDSSVGAIGPNAVAAAVTAQDGTIGYAVLAVALQMNNVIASMVNQAGLTVAPNAESVTYAAVELGTQALSRTTLVMDLTDGTGSAVWPICAMSYLVIDTVNTASTCHARAAIVDFWLWYYQSTVVTGLLSNREYARVPDIVMTSLNILDNIETEVMCRGVAAYTAAAVTTRTMSVPSSISFLASLLTPLYTDPTDAATWSANTVTDQLAFDQLVNGEVDIGFFDPQNVDAGPLQQAQSSGDFLVIPTFMYAKSWMYNPQISSTLSINTYTLRLDFATVTKIFYSCIIYWNDPAILALNPWLYTLIGNTTLIPIQSVRGCGLGVAQAPIAYSYSALLTQYLDATSDVGVAACINGWLGPMANLSGGVPSLLDAALGCVPQPQLYLQYATSEMTIPSLVLGLPGGQGYFIANGDSEFGVPTMPWTRAGVVTDTVANTAGISACASDTFDAATLTFDLSASHNPQCWPWTGQVVAMVRTTYTSRATDTSSCSRGADSLRWLQWLYTNSEIGILTDSVDVQLASGLSSAVQAAYVTALNTATCDGTTLLITLPTAWTLSTGIAAFTQALSAIGVIGCAVGAALVWYHHTHPVIRSASSLFLLLSIAGVALLYTAGFLLVAPATAASCSAFSWSLNFGLMLCFAPLFAKTYRIYRIFGRKKLSVVQLGNRKLFLLVLVMLSVECVLMAAWQGVGPVAPLVADITSSTTNSAGHPIINQYVQCGVRSGASMVMFAVVCVEKGVLFVFGALMAFTTRKVSSTFNESQGISLSIYNVCFTIGIISPIVIVVSAVGDVLTLLLVFALLWIAYFTGGILFVPKLATIYYHTNGKDEVNNSVVAASQSSSGYQFLSLAALSTVPVLQGYQGALRKHLEAVDARINRMKHDKSTVHSSIQQRPSATHAFNQPNSLPSPPLAGRRQTSGEQSVLNDREATNKAASNQPSSRTAVASPALQPRSTAAHALVPARSMTSSMSISKQIVAERSATDDEYSVEDSVDNGKRESVVLSDQMLLHRANTCS